MEKRYTRVAVFLHWLVAALVLLQVGLGWLMQEIPKQPAGVRAEAFNLHKSMGLVLLAIMLARIAWRLAHTPPAMPPMPRWQSHAAAATHMLLYACLVLLPLTGYLGSVFSGYPVRFFGVLLPAWGAKDASLKEWMSLAHLAIAWVLTIAVATHLLGVLKHAWIDRDALLARMAPASAPGRGT